jgi:prevent-host-death family protein
MRRGPCVSRTDVHVKIPQMCAGGMDVAVSTLRAHLSEWVDRARAGEEILVTDRGVPVARLLGVDTAPLLERLVAEGLLSRAGRKPRPRATGHRRVPATRSVAELVSEQRR